jgi:AAA domain
VSATRPALLPVNFKHIPEGLREHPNWIGWKAVWDDAKHKWIKQPRFTAGAFGLLPINRQLGIDFKTAHANLAKAGDNLTGIGYLMNRPHGLVIFDLDHCVESGKVADWARALLQTLGSYAELSPSGTGIRVVVKGDLADGDFSNHEVGIEGYCGSAGRFLTITGQHLKDTPYDVNEVPETTLDSIRARYARKREVVLDVPVPDILSALVLPDVPTEDLSTGTQRLLAGGTTKDDDRSAMLHRAAVELLNTGLSPQETLSHLVHSPALQIALDHRRQDWERAVEYLWVEHCLKAEPKSNAAKTLNAFEDLAINSRAAEPQPEPTEPENDGQMFDALDAMDSVAAEPHPAPTKPGKSPLIPLTQFLVRKPMHWLIKRIVPQAGLGVLFGESGSGKSFIALDMAMALARGLEWRGNRVKRTRVVYVAAEGATGFRNRIDAYLQHNKLDPQDFFEWFRVIDAAPNLMDKQITLQLARDVCDWGNAGLIVVDTLAQTTPGANENAGEDMGKALNHCKGLHKATHAMVLLIHHSGKDSSKGARGWSGLKAAADVELEVINLAGSRCISVTKQKDGESGMQFGFQLQKVPLGLDEDGEVFDSCVTIASMVPVTQAAKADTQGKWEATVRQVIAEIAESQSSGIERTHVRNEAASRVADPDGTDPDYSKRRKQAARMIDKIVDGVGWEWEVSPDEAKKTKTEASFRKA